MVQLTPRLVGVVFLLVVATGVGTAFALDVDGDGIAGTDELGETNPFSGDTDGDGLDDDTEYEFGSDPTVADTDGDGLSDREELYGNPAGDGTYTYGNIVAWEKSDPRSKDTDGDGIPDAKEAEDGLDPTSADSDGDGLSDKREVNGPLDPTLADTDGDNLLDGWEVRGESPKGADLSEADPLHKDMFVHVIYLRNTEYTLPFSVFDNVEEWYADMPVQNPDGETGINVHFTDEERIDRSIDEWEHDDGTTTHGVSGFMAMREFYNQNTIGENTGSHFLVVMAGDGVPIRGSGNAGGSKTNIVTPWLGSERDDARRKAHTITHELLHNVVREIGGRDCNGQMHTCEGFLSYENDYYLSQKSAQKLNQRGFADAVYSEQMNATSCEETIYYKGQCGVEE
ncbi:hypothetical protein [Halorussus halophilus]|uniref:hypothetical protein n=1 Tax=Halorussus halophilus TaxID=2650975 RepID=UPI0013019C0F|nr:hypothetical protein [Halorussus halophilus]